MKYIRLRSIDTPSIELLVAGSGMDARHDNLAGSYRHLGYTVVSAGHYFFDAAGQVVVYGHSHSLAIGPAPDDPQFLATHNNLEACAFTAAHRAAEAA